MKKVVFLTLPALVALLPLTLFLLLSAPFAAAVGPCTVPGSHPTIQAAVNDIACATINVSAGTFNENVVITRSLSIVGAGPVNTTVNGGGVDTVFTIDTGLTVTLESLLIIDGANSSGAGIYNNNSQLTISNTHLVNNTATEDGGAIYNLDGQVTIHNSLLNDNNAEFGGGISSNNLLTINASDLTHNTAIAFGGGIYQTTLTGTLKIKNSNFDQNTAVAGGGIYNVDSSFYMTATNVTSNTAVSSGGGLFSYQAYFKIENSAFIGNEALESYGGGINLTYATMEINNSSFERNKAKDGGGGFYNNIGGEAIITNSYFRLNEAESGGGLFNNLLSAATISNSQFISNTAIDGFGGGISNNLGNLTVGNSAIINNSALGGGGLFNNRVLTMTNSTVSGNTATDGGGLQNQETATISFSSFVNNTATTGGGILAITGTINLNSVIIALNPSGGDCAASGGVIVSQDYNLDSDNSCNLTQPHDLPSAAPLLGPLQDNDGSTRTHALLPGSPGIDDGDTDNCPATDQRGFPRPLGPACDIGAYEAEIVVIYLPVVYKEP